jgi:hypothetical protein
VCSPVPSNAIPEVEFQRVPLGWGNVKLSCHRTLKERFYRHNTVSFTISSRNNSQGSRDVVLQPVSKVSNYCWRCDSPCAVKDTRFEIRGRSAVDPAHPTLSHGVTAQNRSLRRFRFLGLYLTLINAHGPIEQRVGF